MTHPDLDALFDLLDRWRHLPSYRLEPRADVVFGLFLTRALDQHLVPRGISDRSPSHPGISARPR